MENKFIITIELDQNWILTHSEDSELPIVCVVNEIVEIYDKNIEILDSTLSDCSVIVKEDEKDKVVNKIISFIKEKYKIDNTDSILSINIKNYEPKKEEPIKKDNISKDNEKDCEDKKIASSPLIENKIGEIDNLIGAEDFKKLMHEINDVAKVIVDKEVEKIFRYQSFLFSINDGYGLSTALDLLSSIVDINKLYVLNSGKKVFEIKINDNLNNSDYVEKTLQEIDNCGKAVICLDISDVISHTNMADFRQFVKAVIKMNDTKLFVFRIPFVEKSIADNICKNMSDMIYIRNISFVPFTNEEINKYALSLLKKNNFTIEKDALEIFNKRIIEEKSDGRFYGINTINKVISEVIYLKLLNNVKNNTKDNNIKYCDLLNLTFYNNDDNNLSGYEMLDKLVGVESIKNKIIEIVSQIKISMKSSTFSKPCIHMQFVGAPGTGKTTIARIIGKIFKEEGILSLGNFYEYGGRDLVGKYVGHTAPKTLQICRDAYGSVLFIDEAYSLYRSEQSENDFGREALDTLIAEMEAHRNDMVIILAGYDEEMQTLMKGNIGLESRIPFRIEFPNYTRENLIDIFMLMVESKFKYSDNFKESVKEFFTNLPDTVLVSKSFSNARYVRNLFERTWGKAALRTKINKDKDIILMPEDFKNASSEHDFGNMIKKQVRKLGFN